MIEPSQALSQGLSWSHAIHHHSSLATMHMITLTAHFRGTTIITTTLHVYSCPSSQRHTDPRVPSPGCDEASLPMPDRHTVNGSYSTRRAQRKSRYSQLASGGRLERASRYATFWFRFGLGELIVDYRDRTRSDRTICRVDINAVGCPPGFDEYSNSATAAAGGHLAQDFVNVARAHNQDYRFLRVRGGMEGCRYWK